jgi:myosin heavy chain 9/10/11/14
MSDRPRRDRRKEGNKDDSTPGDVTPVEIGGAMLFQKLVNAQQGESEWKTQGGSFVWVNDEAEGFVIGEIKKQDGDSFEVVTTNGQLLTGVKQKDMSPVNPPHLEGSEDMARLTHLNEAAVLHNLRFRYSKDNIYTYSGLFLVAINPYKQLPIYTDEVVKRHQGRGREDVPPHVFTISDQAYRGMLNDKKNQSMLVTGESGAGKTENTKKIIQYLTAVAGASGGGGELEKRLLRTNPLLEAFGNARTVKNNNSSRFGKFIEINFNASGYIVGTTVQNCIFLLLL